MSPPLAVWGFCLFIIHLDKLDYGCLRQMDHGEGWEGRAGRVLPFRVSLFVWSATASENNRNLSR